jgi:hypothetical protein
MGRLKYAVACPKVPEILFELQIDIYDGFLIIFSKG